MTKTSLHISLSHDLKEGALERAKAGRFSTPTEYVRYLIRQDVLRAEAQKEFSAFIKKGIDSPDCKQSSKEMFAETKEELKQRA